MINWKDTVMTSQQIKQLKADLGNHDMDAGYKPEHYDIRWGDKAIAESQAEISFSKGEQQGIEKGRKEVVKWIKEHSPLFIAGQDIALSVSNEIKGETSYYPIIEWLEWQAFTKGMGDRS